MLYLRTGGNGTGKTLFTLKDVREMQLASGRPVCMVLKPDGVDPIRLKPEKVAEFGWQKVKFEDWEKQAPGTIFVVDECQYVLPTRPPSQKPPEHIQRLTEHRSLGFDFFLLTQHPKNIDTYVRNLVQAPGWHQHVKRLAGAAPISNFLQWDAVNLQCEQFGSGKNAQVKTRPFPKEVYDWYDSAERHTGKVRIPKQLIVLLFCLFAIPALFYAGFSKFTGGTPSKAQSAQTADGKAAPGGAPVAGRVLTASEYVDAYRPRIAGLMHTAPAYDELTKPRRVPVPAACLVSKAGGCKCFTQDATPYPAPDSVCRDFVAHGAFLAFMPEGDKPIGQQMPVRAAERPAGVPNEAVAPSGLNFINALPQARPVAPPPPAETPQRIASVKR